jgi:hypothetical protein
MNPILKYIGFAIIIYVFLWITYMVLIYLKIYVFDEYGYPAFMKFIYGK